MIRLADDLLLLLLDAGKGRLRQPRASEFALAGALLIELAERGALRLDSGHPTQLIVVDEGPTGDRELDVAKTVVAERTRPIRAVLARLSKRRIRRDLLAAAEQSGAVGRRSTRVLGFVPSTRWPVQDTARVQELTERIRRATGGQATDGRTAALAGLLSTTSALHTVVGGMTREQARKRAEELVEQVPGEGATAETVRAVRTAIFAQVAAVSVAASAGASS